MAGLATAGRPSARQSMDGELNKASAQLPLESSMHELEEAANSVEGARGLNEVRGFPTRANRAKHCSFPGWLFI